ncbi:MAG: 2-oxo acid dehydrogenase subunit E2 [Solirubrobacterales bacterium]|nr:2-oxo acid dehydrogenase subunit E2 [Solirubrobacterales bacterium]
MPLEFRFPDVGEGIDAGELIEWHVAVGETVREDDPLAEVQTDKATVTIPCPTSGRVLELRAGVGDTVAVGAVLAVFEPAESAAAPALAAAGAAPEAAVAPARPRALASPAVRRRAAELGLDLEQIRGSGPGGRIELGDLEPREQRVVPLRGVRRTIARTMTEAWRTIPHIIDYREVDATALLRRRHELREEATDESVRRALTITPLLLRIAVGALRHHPYVNASIDMEREQITLHSEYNIGVAIAAPQGLVVPVVKEANTKPVSQLALEVTALTAAAHEDRLRPDQVRGGTFTLNNFGSLGGWLGTPIIKPGEVANLGVGRLQERPVAVNGQVVVRPIVALAVSGDHRVLDGHTLAAFVSDVVARIESPSSVT